MGNDSSTSNTKLINELELRQHYTKDSLWIKIDGKVYDVTKFQDQHPGGALALQQVAGQDGSEIFKQIGHSEKAVQTLSKYFIGKFQDLKSNDQKQILQLLQEKEKIIEQFRKNGQLDSVSYQFLKSKKIEDRPKYKTSGIHHNFTKGVEGAVAALEDMNKLTKNLLECADRKHENLVEADHAVLTTYALYKYKLNKLLQLKYENKKDDFSMFECAEKSSIICSRGADNYAKKIALCKENHFEYNFNKENSTRTIKITYFQAQEHEPIIITYDNDGVIKTSQHHEELIGLGILHYIATILHGDISFVTYNSQNQLVYFFESELFQRIPTKNKYVGQDFMSWHIRWSKKAWSFLPEMLTNLMECWAQKKFDLFLADLRNRETYQHKFFKELQIKRIQRDHYFGAFDENDKFIGIMLYTYIYFINHDQMEIPYEGGEFFQWTSPQEFVNSFEVIPFESY